MALPNLPAQGQNPWYTPRNNWDLAVKSELEGRLSDSSLRGVFPTKSQMPVNALDYAAVSGTDQTSNLQAAVNATPVGGSLVFPPGVKFRVDGQININKAMTLYSPGGGGVYSGLSGTTAQTFFNVTSGGVQFRSITIQGPQYAVQANQYGIRFTGTVLSPLSFVSVIDCDISSVAYFGIYAEFVQNIRFESNRVYNIGYAGIMVLSADGGSIDRNFVNNVVKATGYPDAYGISATRGYGSLSDIPRSRNLSISGNRISNIPAWAGIDSHAGQNLKIDGNIITNTYFPVSCVSSRLTVGGAYDLACLDVSITNNQCDSTVTDGSRSSLNLVGNATEKATGNIRGNIVRGYGLQLNAQGGGIQLDYTQGVIVSGNTSIESGLSGIILVSNNDGFVLENNVVIDPWSESANIVKGVWSLGDYNTGLISGTQLIVAGKVATRNLTNGLGIAISSQPNTVISLGVNRAAVAGTPLWDTGNRSRVGFYGSSGTSRAAAIPSPSADVTSLKTAVDSLRAANSAIGVTL